MALGRMTKSMSGMGGVKQQMPVAPPAPKKRSVLSRARAPATAPAVVPQGSPQQPSPNLAPYNASQQGAMNQFNQMAAFTKQQADAQKQSVAMANAPKMPAMRKGGAVNKKPGYAKGGMVMANCGASMKPQQKAKK